MDGIHKVVYVGMLAEWWSFVLIKIMLLICRLLVWFMSLEEKKFVIDLSLDSEGFGLPYVLSRVVLDNFVDCRKCYGIMFGWFRIDICVLIKLL